MAWDPPEHVDLDEVIEAAEEMGYLPDKSGQEYIDHLREDTDVTVMGTPERVRSFFDPQAENWTDPMFPAMDMPGGPLHTPLGPDDEWAQHIAVLVSNLAHVLPDFEDPYGAAVGAGLASSAAYLGYLTVSYVIISLAIAVGLAFEFAAKRKVTQEGS